MLFLATLVLPDVAESATLERTIKETAGGLDILATCSSVSGGSRWYLLDAPARVDSSRVHALVQRLAARGLGASIVWPKS